MNLLRSVRKIVQMRNFLVRATRAFHRLYKVQKILSPHVGRQNVTRGTGEEKGEIKRKEKRKVRKVRNSFVVLIHSFRNVK